MGVGVLEYLLQLLVGEGGDDVEEVLLVQRSSFVDLGRHILFDVWSRSKVFIETFDRYLREMTSIHWLQLFQWNELLLATHDQSDPLLGQVLQRGYIQLRVSMMSS